MNPRPDIDTLRAAYASGAVVRLDRARDGFVLFLVCRNDRIVEVITDPSPAEVAADAIQRLQDAAQ